MQILFGNKRRRREALITERLDGALDAAGERELAEAAAADPELANEIAELEAVAALLREQPQQPAPRSFALSAPPQPAPVRGAGLLQWTQAAAAAAVLALVVLTGADIAGLGGGAGPEPAVPTAELTSGAQMEAASTNGAAPEMFEEAADAAPERLAEKADASATPSAAAEPLPASATADGPFAMDDPESAQGGELKADGAESATQADEAVEEPTQTVVAETSGASALRRAQWAAGAAAAFLVLGAVILRRRAATRWR